MPLRELTIWRNDTQLFLACDGFFAELVPALVELAFVLIGPLLWNVVRSVGGTRREVNEKWLVGHECFLLPDPVDGLLGHVLHQVIALFGRFLHLDGVGAFIERWVPLMGLAANEPVKIFESSSPGWPRIKRTGWTGQPDGHFMALAKLRGRISVQ